MNHETNQLTNFAVHSMQ